MSRFWNKQTYQPQRSQNTDEPRLSKTAVEREDVICVYIFYILYTIWGKQSKYVNKSEKRLVGVQQNN